MFKVFYFLVLFVLENKNCKLKLPKMNSQDKQNGKKKTLNQADSEFLLSATYMARRERN